MLEVVNRLYEDDGWALASHMAMSALMALFPFLIFVAAFAGTVASPTLVNEILTLLFETWPPAVAHPIADEVVKVLGASRPDLLTVGALLAVYLASSGVEAVRVGLNRAYRVRETRPFWITRLQSLGFVLVASVALVVFALLVVLWPVLWRTAVSGLPPLADLQITAAALRFAITTLVVGGAIVLLHCHLTAGGQRLKDVWPGVMVTFGLWIGTGALFGVYLAEFSNYSRTYAGLAGAATALFFLWLVALMFLIGAQINAILLDGRRQREAARKLAAGLIQRPRPVRPG